MRPLFAKFGIQAKGSSTPAGVRDALANCAIPIIMDEVESDNNKYSELIEQNLKIIREASSGDGISTLHGTIDGEGKQWTVITMAFLASIGAVIRHGADSNRFSVLVLEKRNRTDIIQEQKNFRVLEEAVSILTPVWCESFHARTYSIINELLRCIEVMIAQAIVLIKNRRIADQVGSLMAGAWMVTHDTSATAAEAKAFLEKQNIIEIDSSRDQKPDEDLCLDEILSSYVDVSDGAIRSRVTIANALLYFYNEMPGLEGKYSFPGASIKEVKRVLEQKGLKASNKGGLLLKVAIGHPGVKKMLKNTAWVETYHAILMRLDFCDDQIHGPGRFYGIRKRYVRLDMTDVLEEIPF
jgi:putative DNA primase/helicase